MKHQIRERRVRDFGAREEPCAPPPAGAYALRGAHEGRTALVVCPGPSLDEFPQDLLASATTIGVNSAAEAFSPTYWMFVESRFVWYMAPLWRAGRFARIVTRRSHLWIQPWLPVSVQLYWYDYERPIPRRRARARAWWADEATQFLPGHCTILAHGLSLAALMGCARAVIVGADQRVVGGRYYSERVKLNPGPWLPQEALQAGLDWIRANAERVWVGMEIFQAEPCRALPFPTMAVDKVREALSDG